MQQERVKLEEVRFRRSSWPGPSGGFDVTFAVTVNPVTGERHIHATVNCADVARAAGSPLDFGSLVRAFAQGLQAIARDLKLVPFGQTFELSKFIWGALDCWLAKNGWDPGDHD
jgi:hypothetical protein